MKKTLIVVDMQNDFITGTLGTIEAQNIVGNVRQKISEYAARNDEIIFTRDTHHEDYLQTNEGKHLPVEHCIEGTYGWMIADGLEVPGCIYIDKPTFGWTHWDEMEFEEIELVGLCTDICVVSNALILKAFFPEILITVDASCCAGVTPESHEAALITMEMCQIQIVRDNARGIEEPIDPFYSETNKSQLRKAGRQHREGRILERKIEELEALEEDE